MSDRNPHQKIDAQTDIEQLGEKIKDIRMAMLVTADENGVMRSRPMATQKFDKENKFTGELWFFTKEHSPKMALIAKDQHVNLSYAQPDSNTYVSVSGRGELSRDKAKMKELWNPALKAWFPDGLEDPEIALIKVEVDSAEYWDSPNSKLVQLVGFAKAMITGQPLNMEGSHKKLNVQH